MTIPGHSISFCPAATLGASCISSPTPCRVVHFPYGSSRPHSLYRRLLRFPHRFVRSPRFFRGCTRDGAHPYGAGLVRTITTEYNTEIADNECTRSDGL